MVHLKNWDPQELERQVENIHKGYAKGLNCAERVFLTIHSLVETDIPSESVTLLSGFGGGIGGTHENICGSVSGGVAAIGLIYGRRRPPEDSRDIVYEASRDFVFRFKRRFGTIVCRELIGDLLLKDTVVSCKMRGERCFRYHLNAAKMCAETLSKYEKIYDKE
jgi:C_GCAxxG_C_C family probable redox protein